MLDPVENYKMLKELAFENGMSLLGVADVTRIRRTFVIDEDITSDLIYGISIGCRVSEKILETIKEKPNKLYLHHYRTINALLDQTALKLTNFIQDKGFNALPVAASVMLDWQTLGAHISHRLVGYHAGLGWFGRNNLLVNPSYGSKVRYATILTDMPLTTGTPMENGCGECRACVENCPSGAIEEKTFDLNKCHEQLKIYQNKDHLTLICGLCLKCCGAKK